MNNKIKTQLGISFWDTDQATDDRSVGLRILQTYFNTAIQYQSFQFANFNDFLAWAEVATTLATDIGALIRTTEANGTNDEISATNRIIDLANKSQGTAKQGNMIQAAGGTGDTINWTAAVTTIVPQVASDVTGVVQNVGTGVLGTLNMMKYLPLIILAGGAIYLYSKGRSKSGQS